MKLSRRGKSVRRRRDTKRTGKHLRYRGKKVRASKRYNRGHKRTYKRGKRFHRGGVGDEQWKKVKWTEVGEGNPPKKQATGLLVYKKDSTFSLTSESKYFRVTLETPSNLIKNNDNTLHFMEFKVFMERYKKGEDGEIDKTFTVYFAFCYTPQKQINNPGQVFKLTPIRYCLIQIDQNGNFINQSFIELEGPFGNKIEQDVLRTDMSANVDTNKDIVEYINLPEKLSNITGINKLDKSKFDKYIFYGKNNNAFFNSLATQMYRTLKPTIIVPIPSNQ